MFDRILTEIRSADGPVTVAAVARRIGVDVSALRPMIETLQRAGLLDHEAPPGAECPSSCRTHCAPSSCPLVVDLPTPLMARPG